MEGPWVYSLRRPHCGPGCLQGALGQPRGPQSGGHGVGSSLHAWARWFGAMWGTLIPAPWTTAHGPPEGRCRLPLRASTRLALYTARLVQHSTAVTAIKMLSGQGSGLRLEPDSLGSNPGSAALSWAILDK